MQDVSLGSYLKELREKKGIKLEEISKETKILKEVLEKIERNEFSKLPPVYLKGIIRKYTQALGIPKDEAENLIGQLSIETDDNQKKNSKISSSKEKKLVKKIERREKIFSLLIKLLIFIPLILYLGYELSLFILPAEIILVDKSDFSNVNKVIIKGKVIRAKSFSLNGKEINLSPQGNFEEIITLQPGNNQIELKAINPLGKETILSLPIFYQPPVEEKPIEEEIEPPIIQENNQ